MTNRKFFDEPLVRVKLGGMRFPKYCPVCGAPSTTFTWITASTRRNQLIHSRRRPVISATRHERIGLTQEEKKSFHIHVCDDHCVSDDGEWRFRTLAMSIVSIIASFSIFIFIIYGRSIWRGSGSSIWTQLYLLVLFASILIAFVAFRSNALESAFQIVGFDFDIQYVWLKLKNPDYRNMFIQENPMNAELANWILKV